MTTSRSAERFAKRLLSVDEALERILARVAPLPARTLDLADTLGAVLAEDVVADRDVPPFRNSAMDGYAVRGEDVASAPVRLRVTGAVAAGGLPEGTLGSGEAVRIMTGAPMPEGADTVVRVEDTREVGAAVEITVATARGTSVRAAGEDVRSGSTVLAAGRLLRPAEIGVLAALGRARVRVTATPRVAVLSTGDELVELDAPLGPGRIRDANRYSLGAAVRAAGCDPWPLGIARDTADDLRRALVRASEADAIVTSGGVSVGDHDHVKPVVESMGTMDFWSIAIRPGRPLAFGELGPRRTPIFGLPGNPVSALLTFELFVRPALLRLAGRTKVHRPRARAVLTEDVEKPAGLRFFARGVHDPGPGTVRTTGPQGSGILTSMALANCLIDLPETADRADAGSEVTVILTDLPEDH